jgi:nucleoside-diphosphate-sugar epimerase
MNSLLCFGFGYSAQALSRRLIQLGWEIHATSRSKEGRAQIRAFGARDLPFPISNDDLSGKTHLLISAPPDEIGDPVLVAHGNDIAGWTRQFQWVGYLSTTGVYGDLQGGWVDEDSLLIPNTERGRRRLAAENAWLKLCNEQSLPVHIFRLAGIYGPGRNQLLSVLDGSARRIIKPGQVFSRIHVEDIAGVLEASLAHPNPGRAYNVCDDEPCPPQEVIAFAAQLLNRPIPPAIPFEQAQLSPMARSFYADSKRVSNRRIKTELGYRLEYPTYREGLTALAKELPAPSVQAFPNRAPMTGGDRHS